MTKEELLQENARLEHMVEERARKGDAIKSRMARVLKLLDVSITGRYTLYGIKTEELEVLSWEELFFEIGKLIAQKNDSSLSKRVKKLENDIENLPKKINQLNQKNEKRNF